MNDIARNIRRLKASLPGNVKLVAVSKLHPVEAVREAYDAGQRVFGESRTQELKLKQSVLPRDIEWHFIGTLQGNKVKDIIPFIHTIHSIDSLKLLQEVHKQAVKHDRIVNLLLEIHTAQEETKHGLSGEECKALLQNITLSDYPSIRITGLMCIATGTDDTGQVEREFAYLHSLFTELKETYFKTEGYFRELSMGMSHDYTIAIREGSTMVRIGTSIFGER
jgi:pyridoxal phosphate enzyme (YggS family)